MRVTRGIRHTLLAAATALLLVLPHAYAGENKLYKWTDENGVVHYGDHVPARYAKSRTEILNTQGVTIEVRAAEKTPEQLAQEMRLRQLEEEKRAAEEARRAYDLSLLDSYASVDEIRQVRKRRLDAIDGQITFTTHHIAQLKDTITAVEGEIQRLTDRQKKKGIKPTIPKRLTDELDETRAALAEHEENLESHYLDQARIRIKYSEDIERYKILRGIGQATARSGSG